MLDTAHKPQLSVVIVAAGDTLGPHRNTSDLMGNLKALTEQIAPPTMEIIVPYHARMSGIDELRCRFPNVVFLKVENLKTLSSRGGSREHHDELRARGMAVTRGEIVALLEDHVRPDQHWSTSVLKAHRPDYAAVGGAIENGIDRPLNWAVYFCDLGKYQNPLPAGESTFASTVNISYKRSALEAMRPIWQDSFNETKVNWALTTRGEKLALSPDIVVRQFRGDLRLGIALKEFLIWGRSYARVRGQLVGSRRRTVFALLAPLLPGLLLLRMTANVVKKRRSVVAFVRAFPLTALLTVSWSWGELIGYFTLCTNTANAPFANAPFANAPFANAPFANAPFEGPLVIEEQDIKDRKTDEFSRLSADS